MIAHRKRRMTSKELKSLRRNSRRDFLRTAAAGMGGVLIADRFLVRALYARTSPAQGQTEKMVYSLIVVDFNKCTGCRTCETVCSAFNTKVNVNGRELPGLGNPAYSNIRIYPYNPDVDIPVACLMCEDAPCIEACPVEPDPQTKRRALYREGKLPVLHNDLARCIGCGSCAAACSTKRVGAIIPNPASNKPERMCTLCSGDPQCVKYCPNGALSHIVEGTPGQHYGISRDAAAKALTELWYGRE
jgi:Fe-S-cluster-containing hydrogenase component 2